MERLPLLVFPEKRLTEKSRLYGGGGKIHFPAHNKQTQRIGPKFATLERTIANKRLHMVNTPDGLDPEEVLVLEIAGDVVNFHETVQRVHGLEWLAEYESEDLIPDEDFYEKGHAENPYKGKVYLTASNSSAMNQLVSLWNLYSASGETRFPKGLASIKHIFEQLRDIRFWGVEDRLIPDNVEYWLQCIEQNPETPTRIEIELWYRDTSQKRFEAESTVSSLVKSVGGRVIARTEITDIRYHALLAEIPAGRMREILSSIDSNELVQNNNIMIFRPSGQQITAHSEPESKVSLVFQPLNMKDSNPRVAMFDGLPLEKHESIVNCIQVDDPDAFESAYGVDNRSHGTQMCSLIVRGDLSDQDDPISSPVYVRPIMKPIQNNQNKIYEQIPDDILLVDLIHRAVKRMKEGEGGNPPSAPMVRVINYSIGDTRRVFYNAMSPMARLLDWLAYRYNVLFLISAGNVAIPLTVKSVDCFNGLAKSEQSKIVFENLISNRAETKLISPAESINNITIGSTHNDDSDPSVVDRRFNPYDSLMPAIYTRTGGGYRKSIKPDLVFSGGRLFYNEVIASNVAVYPSESFSAPGVKVAIPDSTRNKIAFQCGTSHATALMTHNASKCIDVMEEMGVPGDMQTILLKAMLIHGCSWDIIEQNIKNCIIGSQDTDKKRIVTQWIGYGIPDINIALGCNTQRATAFAIDEISEGQGHVYHFPLPPSLSAKTIARRLTVTLAWMTPICPSTQKYRMTKLWFETPDKMTDERFGPDWRRVKNGTVQHEIFNGNSAQAFIDGNYITIKVSCATDASENTIPVKYSLMVSLENKSDIRLPIYQEISERITTRIPIAQR